MFAILLIGILGAIIFVTFGLIFFKEANEEEPAKKYHNPIPVVVCLVPVHTGASLKVMAVVRAIEPHLGKPALPGGYINKGEAIAPAASRELLEETGLKVKETNWVMVDSAITEKNELLIFMTIKQELIPNIQIVNASFKKNSEVSSLSFLEASEFDKLAFPLHQEAAKKLTTMYYIS